MYNIDADGYGYDEDYEDIIKIENRQHTYG